MKLIRFKWANSISLNAPAQRYVCHFRLSRSFQLERFLAYGNELRLSRYALLYVGINCVMRIGANFGITHATRPMSQASDISAQICIDYRLVSNRIPNYKIHIYANKRYDCLVIASRNFQDLPLSFIQLFGGRLL